MHRTAGQAGTLVDNGETRRWIVLPSGDRPRIGVDVPVEGMADRTNAEWRRRANRGRHHSCEPKANAADTDNACV
ncbi:hypothetical protein, partial [Mesorhizobium sp. M6A.T.Ce.TU.016.01.1.1]|uniref:hypothetical protein n=1 Tax=Mesorhizobium sp. M6A.T.Ce.TU.016.01.1.1 TaxID=2496783 RepID=UPI001FE01F66